MPANWGILFTLACFRAGRAWVPVHGDFTVADGFAYVPGEHLCVVDARDPLNPFVSGCTTGDLWLHSFEWGGTALAGKRLYMATGSLSLRVFDVSDPFAPKYVGALLGAGEAQDVFVAGDRAIVANGHSGIAQLALEPPGGIRLPFSVDRPTGIQDVRIAGAVLYVAAGSSGLRIFPVLDPTMPSRVVDIPAGELSWVEELLLNPPSTYTEGPSIAATPSGAFVVSAATGILRQIHLGATGLELAASLALPGSNSDIALIGNRLVLAAEAAGIRLVDFHCSGVADP